MSRLQKVRLEELEVGMLVDFDRHGDKLYRCRVLDVNYGTGSVRVETLSKRVNRWADEYATTGEKPKERPLFRGWVPAGQLFSVNGSWGSGIAVPLRMD